MPGVLENQSGHSSSSSVDKDGAQVLFNEQTNYVPRRTIITVRFSLAGKKEKRAGKKQSEYSVLTWTLDLFSML